MLTEVRNNSQRMLRDCKCRYMAKNDEIVLPIRILGPVEIVTCDAWEEETYERETLLKMVSKYVVSVLLELL